MVLDEILQAAHASGVIIALKGGNLKLRSATPLPEALVGEARAHKTEIIAALSRTTAAPSIPSGLWAPIPHDAPPMPFDATASDFYYHDAQGNWLFAVRRHIDGMGGETSALWTLHRNEVGGLGWRQAPYPAPRPLFNLPIVVHNPERGLVLVSDERRADRASIRSTRDNIGVAACAGDWAATDLTPIKGRSVSIALAPDEAEPVANLCRQAGAARVYLIDPALIDCPLEVSGRRVDIAEGDRFLEAISEHFGTIPKGRR